MPEQVNCRLVYRHAYSATIERDGLPDIYFSEVFVKDNGSRIRALEYIWSKGWNFTVSWA